MILQGYIDDSGSEPQSKVFLLGGFVSTASRWAKFSDEWDAALREQPAIEYFKTTEAAHFREQFDRKRGWNEQLRDRRISDLVDIIKANVEVGVHVFMKNDTFHQLISSLPLPYRNLSSDNPYSLLFAQIMLAVARFQFIFDARDRCDLIFDQQLGFQIEAMQWWALFQQEATDASKASITRYMGSPPVFKNDKEILPLQAADLYAWHHRRHIEDTRKLYVPEEKVLRALDAVPQFQVPMSDELLGQLRVYLARSADRFAEINPTVPFLPAGKKARRRTRRAIQASPPSPSSSEDEQPC